MSFVNPWALAIGTAALTLPVLIHWLTRPRPVTMSLSTLRFVRQAVQQRRSRQRLRDWLVLGMRTLAVAALAWAIARPLIGRQPLIQPQQGVNAARVVLVDISNSMAAESSGVQLFERARALAAPYLADQQGLQVNLILMGAQPSAVFDRLSTNGAALREALARSATRSERLNLSPALNLAGELLTKDARLGQRRELVVISDLQRTNWASADFTALPEDTLIQVEMVGPEAPLGNLAVLRAGAAGRLEDGRETRLEVEVGNYSAGARNVQVEIELERALYQLKGLCPAGTATVLTTEVLLRGSGWQVGEARLLDVQDALSSDDHRPFVLHVQAAPLYALVTRQPAEQRSTSSYYLERALAPSAGFARGAEPQVVRMTPGELDPEALSAAAVIVMDHPGKLTAETLKTLASQLRHGRGLLYCLAEADDAVNLKKLGDLMGSEWQAPVEFLPPADGQRRKDLFLVDIQRSQPFFAVFGDELNGVMSSLRFSRGLPTRRLARGLADDIQATFSDQSACLVVMPCAAGMVALWNADLGVSNMPSSPAFVPLVNELVGKLSSGYALGVSFPCGEPASFQLPSSVGPLAGLSTAGPDNKPAGELVQDTTGIVWLCPREAKPGVYRVLRAGQTVFAGAAVVPPEESDLRPLSKDVLQERLVGGRRIYVQSGYSEEGGIDLWWTWLVVACLLCMIGEVVLLRIFRV